jgi:murein DD-endopeptidase MepM/ murein hydrolase activator NlpD
MTPARLIAVAIAIVAAACGNGLTGPSPVATNCNPTESTARVAMPMFGRPFAGDFPTGNLFDHDTPVDFTGADGDLLSMCGVHIDKQVNGHNGYDWDMPERTPLFAAAAGTVYSAGLEPPNYCARKKQTVQALVVQIFHTAPNGEEIVSVYGHLSQIDVSAGQTVEAGARIGLSGNTGCSGTPHLHFSAARNLQGRYVIIDPYGWHASFDDPWEVDPRGAASIWLWRPGAAPSLR